MERTPVNTGIIRQLRIVFSISIVILIVSLFASFLSTNKLIDSSKWVNHTNEILIEAENIMSYTKDAESCQRGYIITLDPQFLTPFTAAYVNTIRSYKNVGDLTIDNPVQQKNVEEVKTLVAERFGQMNTVINITKNTRGGIVDTVRRNDELVVGKRIMDELRSTVERVKSLEKRLLEVRLEEQNKYVSSTPILLLLASLISILITGFAYVKIKRDLDERVRKQLHDEEKYLETSKRISVMENITKKISEGDYSVRSVDEKEDELGRISAALNTMVSSLQASFNDLKKKAWLQEGSVKLSDSMRGVRNMEELSSAIISTLTGYINAPMGTLYIKNDGGFSFKLRASYGASGAPENIMGNEGLVGQTAVVQKIIEINDLPSNYVSITSSLGGTLPSSLILLPLIYASESVGVIEIGLLKPLLPIEKEFLETNLEAIGIAVNSSLDYTRLQKLLDESQAQAEELQAQHNELENMNAELEAHTEKLQVSEEELRVQQEELQQTNQELEEGTILLKEKNLEIQKKSEELETATRYKSEFLANMSHELRTPLNSILLLSRLLSENTDKNLNKEEVEYAEVIQSSGHGLLGMIDEILDLSKIEAGKMKMDYIDVDPRDMAEEMNKLFKTMAREKNIEFELEIAENAPKIIETDKVRVEQILKNLISNAIKFTAKGSVTLSISKHSENGVSFKVTDTGIGIPLEKQQLIFEAFQQADGSTKRKYGGTGLGLSISRELVKLLGGEITVSSTVNAGSTFTLYLPLNRKRTLEKMQLGLPKHETMSPEVVPEKPYVSKVIPVSIADDREKVKDSDKTILIIEDDTNFAKSLLDFTHKKGYKGIVAVRGDEGLEMARKHKPLGILLDVELPIKSGMEVMDELKRDPSTRHIPVHMMSSHHLKKESMLKGAVDFIDKPMAFEQMQDIFKKIEYVLNRKAKKVLIIEDNPKHAKALSYFLETFNINSELKGNITDGVSALKNKEVDCVILDMGIPDAKAYEMLEEAKKKPGLENVPIIIFTGKSLSMKEELKIKKYADSIVVKTAHSYQRLLDEVSIFLHLVEDNKEPAQKSTQGKKLRGMNDVLNDKTVLIVDDDVRNIYSLSKSLENYKMKVLTATDGKEGLQILKENPEIDVVLLDMMMPRMDGYETAKAIRGNYAWKNLPVIAVTAKAMTGDREKCIQSGASDYITKPVDMDQLVSLLRVWLYERN